jgi:hypothetical protein
MGVANRRALLALLGAWAGIASAALVGTTYRLELDIGQEKGTWMPPAWGRSGARARAAPVVRFEAGGALRLVGGGAWDHLTVDWLEEDGAVGGWSVEGERAAFHLRHGGVARGDVELEAGELHGTAGAWGELLQRRGTLTIKQRKFGWLPFLPAPRDASFIVGVFTATREDEPPDGDGT